MNCTLYLRVGQGEFFGDVPVEEAVEDDREAQDEVEARVHPRLVQRGAGDSREVTKERKMKKK